MEKARGNYLNFRGSNPPIVTIALPLSADRLYKEKMCSKRSEFFQLQFALVGKILSIQEDF